LAVISLFGWADFFWISSLFFLNPIRSLAGAIIRRRSFVSLYYRLLTFHLGFHIVIGAFNLYSLFHSEGDRDIQNCINNANNGFVASDGQQVTKEVCEKGFEIIRDIAVAIYVTVALIELCALFWCGLSIFWKWLRTIDGCIIVGNYVEQLEEEEAAKIPKMYNDAAAFNNASITNPLPQTTYNSYSGSSNYYSGSPAV
jgi:hypothetical protein